MLHMYRSAGVTGWSRNLLTSQHMACLPRCNEHVAMFRTASTHASVRSLLDRNQLMTAASFQSRCTRWQTSFGETPGRRERSAPRMPVSTLQRSLHPAEIRACQPSGVGSVRMSALGTPCDLLGTTAPGWNNGTPGSQSFRAACSRASTLAEECRRLALPIQPQVQRAWFLRRTRITTTTPRPPFEPPIISRSPPSRVFAARDCLLSHGRHHLPNGWPWSRLDCRVGRHQKSNRELTAVRYRKRQLSRKTRVSLRPVESGDWF